MSATGYDTINYDLKNGANLVSYSIACGIHIPLVTSVSWFVSDSFLQPWASFLLCTLYMYNSCNVKNCYFFIQQETRSIIFNPYKIMKLMCSILYFAQDSRIIVVLYTICDFLHIFFTVLQMLFIIFQTNSFTKFTNILMSLQKSIIIILSYTFSTKQADDDLT